MMLSKNCVMRNPQSKYRYGHFSEYAGFDFPNDFDNANGVMGWPDQLMVVAPHANHANRSTCAAGIVKDAFVLDETFHAHGPALARHPVALA
jgi:hypothetical protein